jgi:hypothetical protein
MEAALDGGGGVLGTYGPMAGLSSQLSSQASAWTEAFAGRLATSGNPTLDGAISDLDGQFRAAAAKLSGASQATSSFVSTTSGNFRSADGGGS